LLLRTPAKLVGVDLRHHRWLDRSRLALRIAIVELIVLVGATTVAIATAGWSWLVPVAVAGPLVAIELWFDVRSRGRRLVPELCGATGIAAVSAAIAIADGAGGSLAVGLWLVLAARSIGAIPFVRVQIGRLRRGHGPVWQSDLAQGVALTVAGAAVAVDARLLAGLLAVAAGAVVQSGWVRREPIPAKQIGLRQMAAGFALVAVTAIGAMW
jgi:hypothetical protein